MGPYPKVHTMSSKKPPSRRRMLETPMKYFPTMSLILQAGMMSYPNFNGADKALQYVDFRLLAEEAERAGVDVRFVYLSRSARGMLVSNTQHNSYGGT